MTKTNPRKIRGPWTDGYVLDIHSTGSVFAGYDEFGHERFDTTRTEIGELLYRLKYKADASALADIGEASERFIRSWKIKFDLIVPVPPTRARKVQPLHQICEELGKRFRVPVVKAVVKKTSGTAELKNLHEFEARSRVLKDSVTADRRLVGGRRVLLVDDLIRSGATMSAVAEAITTAGAPCVYAFALTQTRQA
ncbi:MAG: ComF family protein [Nitrospirae bacterium]|nr:ComF family protein [Nitrospirota bacterium]